MIAGQPSIEKYIPVQHKYHSWRLQIKLSTIVNNQKPTQRPFTIQSLKASSVTISPTLKTFPKLHLPSFSFFTTMNESPFHRSTWKNRFHRILLLLLYYTVISNVDRKKSIALRILSTVLCRSCARPSWTRARPRASHESTAEWCIPGCFRKGETGWFIYIYLMCVCVFVCTV